MTEREIKFLSDILRSILLIESFVADIVTFEAYCGSDKTKAAVERHLAIIGEALNKLAKEFQNNQLQHTSQIIGLRNRIVHAYDALDDSIIWAIIHRYIPLLKQEVEGRIAQSGF